MKQNKCSHCKNGSCALCKHQDCDGKDSSCPQFDVMQSVELVINGKTIELVEESGDILDVVRSALRQWREKYDN